MALNLVALNIDDSKKLVNSFNNSFNNVGKTIDLLINEYQKMDKNMWDSKEKRELDNILNKYFTEIKKYADDGQKTTKSLDNYVEIYRELSDSIYSAVGGNNV